MLIDLLCVAVVWVVVLDLSGFVEEMERLLSKKWKRIVRIRKPWSCSLCMSWWTGLLYLLITGKIAIVSVAVLALVALSTTLIKDIIITVMDLVERFLELLTTKER